ncbi:PREDICTED: uncharacterized protein LOC109238624 [Nicotiana attenuata]|uniref:uncharacterized protein LOC109238624 n=1 Tax=Nicotiana attenuata TaxID=49451 RepID=UPI0009050731|nr:PREDICTED: uncharacterized protein LOC109238624 [Nicotiana attenuata]
MLEDQDDTFCQDRALGLLDAVSTVLPDAHYRYCARHIEANWLKKWRSGKMRKLMWWCAWSTYEEEFKDQLLNLGGMSEDAARDLINYPPKTWCRAYFDTQCKNLMVDNNFTESFNAWTLDARHMPIIKMLENTRIKVMERLADYEGKAMSWNDNFSPPCMKLYHDYRAISHACTLNFNGDNDYEITEGKDKHTVNLEKKRCTCRLRDLSGIPCPHAIKALMHEKIELMTQKHWWYSKEAYLLTYKYKIQPVREVQFWKVLRSQDMEPPELSRWLEDPK